MTVDNFKVSQHRKLVLHTGEVLYGSEKFYVGGSLGDKDCYLRNDGVVCSRMQSNTNQLYGTYFLTQQDAQDCLDRYNAKQATIPSNTQQNDNVQPVTRMVTKTN